MLFRKGRDMAFQQMVGTILELNIHLNFVQIPCSCWHTKEELIVHQLIYWSFLLTWYISVNIVENSIMLIKVRLNWVHNLINCETYSKLEYSFCYLLHNITINIFKSNGQHNIIQSYNNSCHNKAISFITIQHNFSTFYFNATILF